MGRSALFTYRKLLVPIIYILTLHNCDTDKDEEDPDRDAGYNVSHYLFHVTPPSSPLYEHYHSRKKRTVTGVATSSHGSVRTSQFTESVVEGSIAQAIEASKLGKFPSIRQAAESQGLA